LTIPQALLLEARIVRQSLQISHHHSAAQFSLSKATYLSRLSEKASSIGLRLEAASQFELAKTFWSQGESSAAVKLMQRLRHSSDLKTQDVSVDLSEILADLVGNLSWVFVFC
jgi:serine-protein kinase ATM